MRTIELEMSTADTADRIANLVWRDGQVEVTFITEELQPALARWLANGVREWVDVPGGHRVARITPATDPMFLRRLAADLRRQFNFSMYLDERDEPVARVATVHAISVRRANAEPISISRDSQGRLVAGARPPPRPPASTFEWHQR